MFQNNKSQSVWSKIRLYWYRRRKTEFSVVFTTWSRIRFQWKDLKECSSPNFLLRWKLAHVVSSRDTAYLWDTILRETLKPGEYEILSSVILGRKRYKLRMLFCSANLGCTHECGSVYTQRKLDIGTPRVTNSSDNSPLCCIDGHPLIQKFLYTPWESSKEQHHFLTWEIIFGLDEFVHK